MKKITRWDKAVKNDNGDIVRYVFNHIEDGFSKADTPADKFNLGFSKTLWEKDYCFLDENNKVIHFLDAYRLIIPKCCQFQHIQDHFEQLGTCWTLTSCLETDEKPDCRGCDSNIINAKNKKNN